MKEIEMRKGQENKNEEEEVSDFNKYSIDGGDKFIQSLY